MLLATSVTGFCQGIPGCYPQHIPAVKPCVPDRPAPISRTVQVDVPVPCAPLACNVRIPCPPQPCVLPACGPPCPTQPVRVRVDVVVRPEAPKPCVPERFCCENPPVFEPIFCQAASLVESLIAAPLALGETLMGHPVPLPMPAARPVPCWHVPAAMASPCFQPPPTTKCMVPCPLQARCAPPESPKARARPVCVPYSGLPHGPKNPFSR